MIELKLEEKMKEQGVSIADLVELTNDHASDNKGVHRNTISKLLNGKSKGVQFDTLDLLCKALGCKTIIDLIKYIPNED